MVLVAGMAAALLAGTFGTARSQTGEARPVLRVVCLDAASLAGLAPVAETVRSPWRTSFGSERRSAPEVKVPKSALDADVVLLTGVTRIGSVRRLLPAKDWKLVVSRQTLAADDSPPSSKAGGSAARSLTAVAVRLQGGVRVTREEHLAALAPPAAEEGPAKPRATAGTAVHIQTGTTGLWAVALDLDTGSCAPDEQGCTEPRALADWRRAKLDGGEAVVAGGRIEIGAAMGPPPPCPGLGIVRYASGAEPDRRAPAAIEGDLGCVARASLGAGG